MRKQLQCLLPLSINQYCLQIYQRLDGFNVSLYLSNASVRCVPGTSPLYFFGGWWGRFPDLNTNFYTDVLKQKIEIFKNMTSTFLHVQNFFFFV